MYEPVLMSKENTSLSRSIGSNALLLGIFALACTAFIAATFLGTEDDIIKRKREAQLKALIEIVPKKHHDNDMLNSKLLFYREELGHRKEQALFLAKKNNQPVTLIYPATARDGYSGDINFIIGINTKNHTIAGVRVLNHRETPGLGDAIELRKSNWILGFNNKSLSHPSSKRWTVTKDGGDFDAFTGATITPRALTKAIANVLTFHQQHSGDLLKEFNAQ